MLTSSYLAKPATQQQSASETKRRPLPQHFHPPSSLAARCFFIFQFGHDFSSRSLLQSEEIQRIQ
jgi:hypothetical protein